MDKTKKTQSIANFNIRVYGIVIEDNHILLSDELFKGIKMTKFPGGGLEFGEGTIDCLKRETLEELNCKIEIINHFYTTDYFQPTLFFTNTQLISIYYLIKLKKSLQIPISETPNYPDHEQMPNFRWVSLSSLDPQKLTFPIDKIVAELIIKRYKKDK